MLDAYIYDGLRTPIGRHAGKLAPVRPDDLAAEVAEGGRDAQQDRPGGNQRRRHGLRHPGRRGQPQRRALRRPARRPAADHARRHRQPPVRERPAGGRRRGARHHLRRRRSVHRRRRREHEPRALRPGQVRFAFQPRSEDVRHHDRLALPQPEGGEAVRQPHDAGDRRQRRARTSASRASRPTSSPSPRSRTTPRPRPRASTRARFTPSRSPEKKNPSR